MSDKIKVWLTDLTYIQQTIASDVIPAAVGGIGAFVQQELPNTEVKIFKLPSDLSQAFENDVPHIIGFSTYCWSSDLAYQCSRVIRKRFPQVTIVWGGPHFPLDTKAQKAYLKERPAIDFYINKEGELAFVTLLKKLIDHNWDKEADYSDVNNLVYVDASQTLRKSPTIERQMDLTKFPSPYLTGLLDKFLDGRYAPIIQTNRGCPFRCTFCSEGREFWNKVRTKDMDLILNELNYIAEKMSSIPAAKSRNDLMIADSNFGMFRQDITIAGWIGELQKKYKYPTYLNVTTGKNQKERVMEAAKLVNSAMRLTGSVQSLDPDILSIIKRSNISENKLMDLALEASKAGTTSYSEVILGLPGDSKKKHFTTLEKLVNAGFNSISSHQLMLLSDSDLGSEQTRQTYELKTRFRIQPRCFGYYDFLGELICCAEIEEIGVGNNTMSYDDYIECRKMGIITIIFLNNDIFSDIFKLLRLLNIPRWEFFRNVYENSYHSRFDQLLENFLKEIKAETHIDRLALERSIRDPKMIDEYIAGERGNNVNFKFRGLSITTYFDATLFVAKASLEAVFNKYKVAKAWRTLGKELIGFNGFKLRDVFVKDPKQHQGDFAFDVIGFSNPKMDSLNIENIKLSSPRTIHFKHSTKQQHDIQGFLNSFGGDEKGVTRILSRATTRHFFRTPTWAPHMSTHNSI